MKLYSYFRSSASYRVRIALNLKGISYDMDCVHLARGEHHKDAYKKVNAQARLPSLELDSGAVLTQSPAIIEYLEEAYPNPPLLPKDKVERAKVRAIASLIACDIQPLGNMTVLKYLRAPLNHDEDAVNAWIANWIDQGFRAVETLLVPGPYALGKEVSLADVYIVPQVFNARRFNITLKEFPKLTAAVEACEKLDAFARAHPSKQPDAES